WSVRVFGFVPRKRHAWVAAVVVGVACAIAITTAQQSAPKTGTDTAVTTSNQASIRITSPLGRTGVATRLRIVAQVQVPAGHPLSPVNFFVDGTLVGTADAGPYCAVDWTDDNPFERREIVVQAADDAGRVI